MIGGTLDRKPTLGRPIGGTWDDAQKTIDRFERAAELIKKFPVKSIYHKPEPTKWTTGGTLEGCWDSV